MAILVVKTPHRAFLHFTGNGEASEVSRRKLSQEYGGGVEIQAFAINEHEAARRVAERFDQENLERRLQDWLGGLEFTPPEKDKILQLIDRLSRKMTRGEALELTTQEIATTWAICFLQIFDQAHGQGD